MKTLLLSMAAFATSFAATAQVNPTGASTKAWPVQQRATAKFRAPSEDSPIAIKANLISKNNKANGAICSIAVPGNGGYETLTSNDYMKSNLAGVWVNNNYYFTQFEEFFGNIYANFDAYNTTTWERVSHVNSGLTWADCPTDLTLSLKDNVVYGCFSNVAHNGYQLGTLDLSSGKCTAIAPLSQQMVAVASYDGTLYTIGADGVLYTASTTNGALTTVGSTGLKPDATKVQSATTDPASGTIYWAAQLTSNQSALYSLNPASGEATKLFDFAAREQWVGLFIEGEETPGEGPGVDPENPDDHEPIVHENSFFEDFEGCDGNYYHEWLPYKWEDRSAAGHVGQNPDNWMDQQNLTWQTGSIKDGTGHPAYEGDYCAFINVSTAWSGHPNEVQDEWLITPNIKVKKDEYLYFQLSYSPGWTRWNRQTWDYSGQNNILEVQLSTDGGETWTKMWDCMEYASELSDEELEADRSTTNHPYVPVYVDLADYADQDIRIAFRYVGINGQSMSIDDVTIGLPLPEARYELAEGVYREALSPRMSYPKNPVLWAPADTELTWKSQTVHSQKFHWSYDGGTSTTTDLVTPAYTKGQTVGTPSLQTTFGQNKSRIFTDNFKAMQIEGTLTDTDDEGNTCEFGIANYDFADPNAYVGFNRTFGFDADSYDKWSGLAGRLIYTVIPSCAVSAYSAPAKPYLINSIYANVKVEQISPNTEVTCDLWITDETGTYITECIGNAHLMAEGIESLYPDDVDNASWSIMQFDFSEQPLYIDRQIYVMIGGFNPDTDAVYFPGISTPDANNQAASYFGVVDYNDDAEGIFKLYDVNSYNIGTTGRRHIAGFLIGLNATYDIPEGIESIPAAGAADSTLYDLQGRRLNQRPAAGMYIENGQKRIAK